MRWLKHLSTSHTDENLSQLMDKFGPAGYGIWWIILETIAQLMDETERCHARYSIQTWAKLCRTRSDHVARVCRVLHEMKLINVRVDDDFMLIECRNLLKYRDEFTKKVARKSGVTPDKLRSDSGVTPEQDVDVDVYKENNNNIKTIVITKESLPTPESKASKAVQEKRARQFPKNLALSDRHREYVQKKGWLNLNLEDQFEAFETHHKSKGSRFVDWDLAFYQWLRNSQTRFAAKSAVMHYKTKEQLEEEERQRFLSNTNFITEDDYRDCG